MTLILLMHATLSRPLSSDSGKDLAYIFSGSCVSIVLLNVCPWFVSFLLKRLLL